MTDQEDEGKSIVNRYEYQHESSSVGSMSQGLTLSKFNEFCFCLEDDIIMLFFVLIK